MRVVDPSILGHMAQTNVAQRPRFYKIHNVNDLFEHGIQLLLQPSGGKILPTHGVKIFRLLVDFLHSGTKSWRDLNDVGKSSVHKSKR